jgi:hypothetical protein
MSVSDQRDLLRAMNSGAITMVWPDMKKHSTKEEFIWSEKCPTNPKKKSETRCSYVLLCLRQGYSSLSFLLVWPVYFKYENKNGTFVHSTVQRSLIWKVRFELTAELDISTTGVPKAYIQF